MKLGLRFFSREMTASQRWVYGTATLYFIAVAAAMTWPVYALFSRVRPLVLGMPFGLFYLAVLVVVSFVVALALYLWEEWQGVFDEPDESGDAA